MRVRLRSRFGFTLAALSISLFLLPSPTPAAIDSPAASWTIVGEGQDKLGFSVATAGDVNGDGYADLIVGAPLRESPPPLGQGSAFVYLGGPLGLSTSGVVFGGQGGQFDYQFGTAVSTAGDVNGDGFDDVIVGAPYFDGGGKTDRGKAFVFYGSSTGIVTSAAWTAEGDQAHALFGSAVHAAGDVNGDGYGDIVVGQPWYDDQVHDGFAGRAYVFLGSPGGLSTVPAWVDTGGPAAMFGYAVNTAGDVDGDGFDDVIVGAIGHSHGQLHEGGAYVYRGSASGLSSSPVWSAESDGVLAEFGRSVSTAGDVNGDGLDDVIIGAANPANNPQVPSSARVYLGSPSGLSPTPSWQSASLPPNTLAGYSVAGAGDVNGDGYDDVIVGAPNVHKNQGMTFVYFGSATGLAPIPFWNATTDVPGLFGFSVSTGDVNGDGRADILVGGPGYLGGGGRASAYYGQPLNSVGAGRVPAGSLLAAKAGSGLLTLSWDPSCLATDDDYAIYQGQMHGFDAHAPLFCSTGGATQKTFATPTFPRVYFLVVPLDATQEGSYGTDSYFTERPPGASSCKVQSVKQCP
jgi:hypothetical protein